MIIESDGDVGIGVTAASNQLDIDAGTGFGTIELDGSTGGCLMIRDTDDGGWTQCEALNGVLACTVDDGDGVCD